jgi:hypothetical protein
LADLAAWAAYADAGEFWIVVALLAAAALACFFFAFWFLRKARLLEDTPTSRIRSAAQGYVELDGVGRLLDGPTIASPLTGLPCVWWEYCIEERVTTGHGKHRTTQWRTLASRSSDCLFRLDDDTGWCVVDPGGAMVITEARARWHGASSRWTGPPPASGWRRWGGGRYRFTERRLGRSRPLYAIGWFRTEGGAGSDFDTAEEVRLRLAEWKRDQAALVARFDADGDGAIDLAEWETARRAAEDEVRREQLERALAPGVHVLAKPPRHIRKPFLLSAVPQERLTRRFRWSAAALLVGFFLAGGFGTFMVSARVVL